jgi:cytochrome c553
MPKHIFRLILLIVVFGVAAIAAKSFFTVGSFYRYGHYRADSVPQIAGMATSFQTPKACLSCHAPRHAEWSTGHHKTVICEVCHGAAPGHPETLKVTITTDTPRLCTQCHEKMPGRPASSIRQIDPREHFAASTQCIACHDPHAPKIADPSVKVAFDHKAAAASSATCAACHGDNGVATNPAWPNLAGQNEAYLARALGSFKTGARKNDMMGPMAQALPDDDVPNVARHYSQMSCRSAGGKAGSGRAAEGKALAAKCVTCHGDSGRPVNTAWPSLAGQNPAYLASALAAFKSGERANPFMSPATSGLSDADMADLATYFAGLGCGASSH